MHKMKIPQILTLILISEAMGHSSITVTETYLKPFRSKKNEEANKQVLDFVKRSVIGVIA